MIDKNKHCIKNKSKTPDNYSPYKLQYLMHEWKTSIDSSILDRSRIIYFADYIDDGRFILNVYTEYPGYLIGKQGQKIKWYAERMKAIGIDAIYMTEIKQYNIV